MLVLIDNYDSFTYNLVQYFQILGQEVLVYKNDAVDISRLKEIDPNQIVISPGPNGPEEAGISLEVIQEFYTSKPILGVCLGHQCLGHAFGAQIIHAPEVIHGQSSRLIHNHLGLFRHLPPHLNVGRYHSLAVDINTLSPDWRIDALTEDGVIMAITHQYYPLFGVQFHPESVLSEFGLVLCQNFLHAHIAY